MPNFKVSLLCASVLSFCGAAGFASLAQAQTTPEPINITAPKTNSSITFTGSQLTPLYTGTEGQNFFFSKDTKVLSYDSQTREIIKGRPQLSYNKEMVDCVSGNMGRIVWAYRVLSVPSTEADKVRLIEERDIETETTQLTQRLRDETPSLTDTQMNYIAHVCAQYQVTSYNEIQEAKPLVLANGTVIGAPTGYLTASKTPDSAPQLPQYQKRTLAPTVSGKDDQPIDRKGFGHLKSTDKAHMFAGNFKYLPTQGWLQFDTLATTFDGSALPENTQVLSTVILDCKAEKGNSFRQQVKTPGQKLQVLVQPQDVDIKALSVAQKLAGFPKAFQSTFQQICAEHAPK